MADPLGVSLAFDDGPLAVAPTWTRLDTQAGCRVQEWQIRRGRTSEFGQTGAGTATVRIADLEGLFDPTNPSSTYVDGIEPHKQAAIALRDPVLNTWHTLFRGFVEDWSYTLDISRKVIWIDLHLVDAFALLSADELQVGVDGDAVLDGNVIYAEAQVDDRIKTLLSEYGWPSGLWDIFSGNVTVREKTYAPGTQRLAAIYDAAEAEFPGVANAYMSKTGMFTFHGRQARFRPDVAAYGINERDVGDPSLWDTDATAVPLAELGWVRGNAELYNAALAYPEGAADADIAAQWVSDATSITDNGRSMAPAMDNLQTLSGLATNSTALVETKTFASYYVDNYKTPRNRINRMVFRSRMPDAQNAGPLWLQMCRVEISDLLNVTTAHPGGGGFAADACFVEGITYQGRPANAQVHDITLTCDVSPRAYFTSNPWPTDAEI